MGDDVLRYDLMVEDALRGVVREALRQIEDRGSLPGDHHFYISFQTTFPGASVPPSLKEKYPKEMTIVLQYQFWGLDVGNDAFAVTLSFNDIQERVTVPFAAITSFADPAVQFGLQFQTAEGADLEITDLMDELDEDEPPMMKPKKPGSDDAPPTAPKGGGKGKKSKGGEKSGEKVVSLDSFRKK